MEGIVPNKAVTNQTNGQQLTQLYDPATNVNAFIDRFGNLRTANTKRILGSNFGSSIDTTYLYTITNNNDGTTTASNGVCTLATSVTANGNTNIVTKGKIRYLSGRNNLNRFIVRFGDTGGANNVREFGIYVDSNNEYVFRLTGSTFCVSFKKAGSNNTVNSGSFNGNGTSSGGSWTVDTDFHSFEILVSGSRTIFIIDGEAIHTFFATTTSLITSLVGNLYASNVNSGGATTNRLLELLAISGNQIGDAVNNPIYYNYAGATGVETRTLKGGGGTLQSISIGSAGGANSSITFYDNTAASGTIIVKFDLTKDQAIGTHVFGIDGVNFYNGLTYITAGTLTGASVTTFWE